MKALFDKLLATSPCTARRQLKENGYKVDFFKISPPSSRKESGRKRVIAIRKLNSDTLRVIWSYENFNF